MEEESRVVDLATGERATEVQMAAAVVVSMAVAVTAVG